MRPITITNEMRGMGLSEDRTRSEVEVFQSFIQAVNSLATDVQHELIIERIEPVTANITVPANIKLHFTRGGRLRISAACTVTIASPEHIVAEPRQYIFECLTYVALADGAVRFTNVGRVTPQWWGAVGAAPIYGGDLVTGNWINDVGNPYETLTSAGGNITSAINTVGMGLGFYDFAAALTVGQLYYLTYTLTMNSGEIPAFLLQSGHGAGTLIDWTGTIAAGTHTLRFTAPANANNLTVFNSIASNWSCTFTLRAVSGYDDTTPIQRALDSLYASGGGEVHFPAGDYSMTSVVNTFLDNTQLKITGEGRLLTVFHKLGDDTDPLFDLQAATITIVHLWMDGMAFNCDDSFVAVNIINLAYLKLKNLYLIAAEIGINIEGGITGQIEDSIFYVCKTGLLTDETVGQGGVNFLKIKDSIFSGNWYRGLNLIGDAGLLLDNCDLENNGTTLDTTTGALFTGAKIGKLASYGFVCINECWFENNDGWDIYFADTDYKAYFSVTKCIGLSGENGIYVGAGATSPKFMALSCQWPTNDLVFKVASTNIVGFVSNCIFTDILNLSGNFIHIVGTDYAAAFHPEYRDILTNVIYQTRVIVPDGDTTPSVALARFLETSANTGATAITDLDDPTPGQVVTIICGSLTNASTIADGGNFRLAGNWIPAAVGDNITLFVRADNDYIELSRVAV